MTALLQIIPPLAFIFCPLGGAMLVLLFFNARRVVFIISIVGSCLSFLASLWIYYIFNFYGIINYQYFVGFYSVGLVLGVDKLSLVFLLLTCFIMPICVYASFSIQNNYKLFIVHLFFIEILLVLSFTALNLLVFYVFFESVLIPMFLLINRWGSRSRKIKASYYLFLYTLAGSFLLLTAILTIFIIYGTANFEIILNVSPTYPIMSSWLWWLLFIPFAVKTPMFPFHIWLPEAHVEAPTVGSVILASLLLKLGGYGMLRVLFSITDNLTTFHPAAFAIALASVIFASLATIRQTDLKKIVAYSSIAHMNIVVLGIFSGSKQGIDGSIYLMVGHAFVSSLLFLCIGVLYDRHHSRLLRYFGGLAQVMPIFSSVLFIGILANMGFPGTCNFLGEFLIFIGLISAVSTQSKIFILLAASSSIVLSAVYSIWVYNRVIFGALKIKYIENFSDINFREMLIFIALITCIIAFGLKNLLF